jgi:hypothetical protein
MHTELASWKAKSLSLASGKKKIVRLGKCAVDFHGEIKRGKAKCTLSIGRPYANQSWRVDCDFVVYMV